MSIERQAFCHCSLSMGGGLETETIGNRGGRGGVSDGTHYIWPTSNIGILFQIPRSVPVSIRRQLDGGDLELAERATEMGASIVGAQKGGGRCTDVGNILHHCVSSGSPLWVGVVGNVPADWEGDGQNSPSEDTSADGADTTSERIWDVDIPSPGTVNGGCRPLEDRKLCHPYPKSCRVKYCDKANYGPISGGVLASRKQVLKRYWDK